MKRLLLSMIGIAALLGSLSPSAIAAPWQSINQRQAVMEELIDRGIRNGALTRAEAIVLRGEFDTLASLEASYRRSGGYLTAGERRDLDDRFDRLRLRIRIQKNDPQVRPESRWVSINDRQEWVEERIERGVRRGTITRTEAIELRGEFKTLVRLESEYRRSRGAFTTEERADLERRLDRLSRRVTSERRDSQSRF